MSKGELLEGLPVGSHQTTNRFIVGDAGDGTGIAHIATVDLHQSAIPG